MPIAVRIRKTVNVKLAHPLKTKLIAESKKTDKVDAKVLADLARTNFLSEAYLPPDDILELREIIRERVRLKRLSVSIKNRIHSILTKNGIKIEKPFTKDGREELRSMGNKWINRYLRILEKIEDEISEIDKEIKRICLMNDEISILLTIPGIGYFSALLIYAEVGDINRFPNSKKLCSYAGLVPTVRQSGNKIIRGRITKEGNKLLRWVLVQCAHMAVRKDERFKRLEDKTQKGASESNSSYSEKTTNGDLCMLEEQNSIR